MARIEFRGQTYNHEFEMPYEVRQAYRQEKEQQAEKDKHSGAASAVDKSISKPLTEIVDMSPEVKAIYERAVGNVEDRLPSSQESKNLPKAEDIYRPSQPLIDPEQSAIEPEPALSMKRFVSSLVWVLILVAIAFLVLRFF